MKTCEEVQTSAAMQSTSPQKFPPPPDTATFCTENDHHPLVTAPPIHMAVTAPAELPPPSAPLQSQPSDSGLMTPEEELLLEEGEIADDSLMEFDDEIDPALTASLRHESEKINAWSQENPHGERRYSKELMDLIGKLPASNREPEFVQKFRQGDANFAFVDELFAERKSQPVSTRGGTWPGGLSGQMDYGGGAGGSRFNVGWNRQGAGPAPPPRHIMGPPAAAGSRGKADRYTGSKSGSMRNRERDGGGGRGSQYRGRGSMHAQAPPAPLEEVELRTAENAWKPKRKKSFCRDDPSAFICERVRAILNKITPQSFDELVAEFLALIKDDEDDAMKSVIDIVFDKAVDEPNFCELYARMCGCVVNAQLKSTQTRTSNEAQPKSPFRNLLLNKCQIEFEQERTTQEQVIELRKQAADEANAEKRQQLTEEADILEAKQKRRMLGNVRFIGQLYLKEMLIPKIVSACFVQLLSKQDEESLECLVRFLETTGKKFEADEKKMPVNPKQPDRKGYFFGEVFRKIEEIRENKAIPSRIRFMIQDLLEMRENQWVPRRKEAGPKKIEELHAEIQQERIESHQQAIAHEQQKRQEARAERRNPKQLPSGRPSQEGRDRRGPGGGGAGGSQRGDDRRQPQQPQPAPPADRTPVNVSALQKHLGAGAPITLGGRRWGPSARSTGGENVGGSRTTPQPGSSRDSSTTRQEEIQKAKNTVTQVLQQGAHPAPPPAPAAGAAASASQPASTPQSPTPVETPSRTPEPVPAAADVEELELTEEQKAERNMHDVLNDEANKDPVDLWKEYGHLSPLQLRIGFLYSLERGHKGNFIERWSRLLRIYVENRLIDFGEIVDACLKAIEVAEDGFMEDTPNFYAWMGEMLGTVICDANASLDAVRPIVDKAAWKARDFVAQLLLTVQNEKSPETMERLWRCCTKLDASQMRLNEAEFLSKKPYLRPLFEAPPPDPPAPKSRGASAAVEEAASAATCSSEPQASVNADEKLRDLEIYLRHQVTPTTTKDEIIDWIEDNVPPSVRQSSQFIRALANQLCSSVIGNPENKTAFADTHCKVLMKFVQGNRVFELATVEAAAEVCRLHQFPKGALLEFFEALRDECVIPAETFLLWWDQQKASPWAGMYVRDALLKAFFTILNEETTWPEPQGAAGDAEAVETPGVEEL